MNITHYPNFSLPQYRMKNNRSRKPHVPLTQVISDDFERYMLCLYSNSRGTIKVYILLFGEKRVYDRIDTKGQPKFVRVSRTQRLRDFKLLKEVLSAPQAQS